MPDHQQEQPHDPEHDHTQSHLSEMSCVYALLKAFSPKRAMSSRLRSIF